MRALVTGATGFLGRHLSRRLAAGGDRVRALVRSDTDLRSFTRAGIEIVRGDVRDWSSVEDALEGHDVVYHLAGRTGRYRLAAREFTAVNARGTEVVARAAARAGVPRFVLASSTSVYGNAIRNQKIDERTATRPDTHYGRSKLCAERIVRRVGEERGLEIVVARISSTLGPGATTWIGLFQAIAENRFRMLGRGDNLHHPGDVVDVVEGLVLCATQERAAGGTYVLAGPEPVRLRDFVAGIGEEMGSPIRGRGRPAAPLLAYRSANRLATALGWRSLPRYDRVEFFLGDRAFDLSRARDELGYAPAICVREGIHRTAEWLRREGLVP